MFEEFDIRLGISEPSEDVVDAATMLLERISLSIREDHSRGFLVPIDSATGSTGTSGISTAAVQLASTTGSSNTASATRKRGATGMGDDDGGEDLQDDDEEGGGASIGTTSPGTRKKSKVQQYPCPYRKRNPLRFNIREYEYCAKAPFKTFSDLK